MIIQFIVCQNNVWTLIFKWSNFVMFLALLIYFFTACGMWDLISLTRDQTWTPAVIESSWLDCQGNPRLVSAEPLLIQEKWIICDPLSSKLIFKIIAKIAKYLFCIWLQLNCLVVCFFYNNSICNVVLSNL